LREESNLQAFAHYEGFVGDLLASADLKEIDRRATDVPTNPDLLEAFRYFAGPPLSADDLKTLSDGVLSPARLRKDPDMIRRIVHIVRMGLDRRRFPGYLKTANPQPRNARRLCWRPPR
jgi:hypothetical protein